MSKGAPRESAFERRTKSLEEVVFQEVPGGVCRVDRPPVVHGDIEDTEKDDEEGRGPLGLETNGDHDAGDKTDQGDESTADGPFALDDETNEEENEEDTTGEEETTSKISSVSS